MSQNQEQDPDEQIKEKLIRIWDELPPEVLDARERFMLILAYGLPQQTPHRHGLLEIRRELSVAPKGIRIAQTSAEHVRQIILKALGKVEQVYRQRYGSMPISLSNTTQQEEQERALLEHQSGEQNYVADELLALLDRAEHLLFVGDGDFGDWLDDYAAWKRAHPHPTDKSSSCIKRS